MDRIIVANIEEGQVVAMSCFLQYIFDWIKLLLKLYAGEKVQSCRSKLRSWMWPLKYLVFTTYVHAYEIVHY